MKKEFLSADTRIAIRQLLSAHSDAFHVLHDVLNFDFERPFAVHYLEGSFTLRQVLKLTRTNNPEPQTIALLMEDPTTAPGFCSVTALDEDGKFNLNLNVRFCEDFGSFKSKKDIETQRKKSAVKTFVVVQNAAFHAPKKAPKEPNLNGRFVSATGDRPTSVEHFAVLRAYSGDSSSFMYQIPFVPRKDEEDVLDKSGYLALERKAELLRKARKLRCQKERNDYLQSDRETELRQLAEMERTMANIKADLLAQLSAATAAQQYREIGAIVKLYFSNVVDYVQDFKSQTAARTFASVKEREAGYQKILRLINRLQSNVDESAQELREFSGQ